MIRHPQSSTGTRKLSGRDFRRLAVGFSRAVSIELGLLGDSVAGQDCRDYVGTLIASRDLYTLMLPESISELASDVNTSEARRSLVMNLYVRLRSMMLLVEDGEDLLDTYLISLVRDLTSSDSRSLINENLHHSLYMSDTYLRECFKFNPWLKVPLLIRLVYVLGEEL